MKLDDTDLQILDIVQDDCRTPADAIADAVGLSPSAVQRRLSKLRAEGVIAREVAVVDPAAVGRPLLLVAEVTLERDDEAAVRAFRDAMRKAPEVMQCYFVTGGADYIVVCAVRDMEEYDAFIERAFFANPHVSGTATKVVIKPVKSGQKIVCA